jgi:hypothetical protein
VKADDTLRRGHMSDSAIVRQRAARLAADLDELATLLETNTPAAARLAAIELHRARLLDALRAERFPTPATLATT